MASHTGPDNLHKLDIWRDGIRLVKSVYELTAHWPGPEKYGLTAQVRRAAVSVPTNLAEGVGRGSSPEIARFARVALGSLYEIETLFELVRELGYEAPDAELRASVVDLIRRTSCFMQYHRSKPRPLRH